MLEACVGEVAAIHSAWWHKKFSLIKSPGNTWDVGNTRFNACVSDFGTDTGDAGPTMTYMSRDPRSALRVLEYTNVRPANSSVGELRPIGSCEKRAKYPIWKAMGRSHTKRAACSACCVTAVEQFCEGKVIGSRSGRVSITDQKSVGLVNR